MAEGSSTVTVGGIDASDLVNDENQRAEALRSFLSGNPFGAPTRAEQVGYTSQHPDDILNRPEPPTLEQEIANAEQAIANMVNPQPVADWEGEARKWMKQYGDRENEYGELRRKNAELEETVNLILAQQAVAPQQQPQPQQNFSLPMQALPQPGPMFGNKDKGEYVTVAEAEAATEAKFNPFFGMMAQHAQYLENQIQTLRKQNFDQAKRAAGIDAMTEIRTKAKYPMLNTMPDGPEKLTLIQSLAGLDKVAPAPQAPMVPVPQPHIANQIVRRATLTESNRGASGEPAADPNAVRNAEMAAAQALPFHLRSAAMEKIMRKYGVQTVNTFASGRFRV